MSKILVLSNRLAAQNGESNWEQKIKLFFPNQVVVFHELNSNVDIKSEVQFALDNAFHVIILIGGDGTVNRIIPYLLHTSIKLLIIPAGTANDLARELNLMRPIQDLLNLVNQDQYKAIDIIQVNSEYMATNGGIGIGATLIHQISYLRKKFPWFKFILRSFKNRTYDLFLLYNFLRPKFAIHKLKLKISEDEYFCQTAMLMILNQNKIAGKLKIVDHSTNDDGQFDVVCFKSQSRLMLIFTALRIIAGNIPKSTDNLLILKAKEAIITAHDHKNLLFWGDGECFALASTYQINLHHQALKVYFY